MPHRDKISPLIPERPLSVAVAREADPEAEPLAEWERELLMNRQKSVYIAGPMRGFPEHNYPAFNAVAKLLRSQGRKVFCPSENFNGDQTREYHEYMNLDLRMVMDADGIVLLPGWEKSEGAKLEANVAKVLSKQFFEARPIEPSGWVVEDSATPKTIGDQGIESVARRLVYGDRNESYGPPSHDFACTGRKWAATLSAHTGTTIPDIPPEIVSVMMMDLKTSRLGGNPGHYDSRVDVIGYALCHDRIITDDGRVYDITAA